MANTERTPHRTEWYKRQFTIVGDVDSPENKNVNVTESPKTNITKLTQCWDALNRLIETAPKRCGRYGQGRPVRAFEKEDHDSDCDEDGLCSKVSEIEEAFIEFTEELFKPFDDVEVHIHRYVSVFDIDDEAETMCTDWTYIVNIQTKGAHYFGIIHLKCYYDEPAEIPLPGTIGNMGDPMCSYTRKLSDYIQDDFFWAGENDAGESCNVLEVFYGLPKAVSIQSLCELIGLERTYTNDDASV